MPIASLLLRLSAAALMMCAAAADGGSSSSGDMAKTIVAGDGMRVDFVGQSGQIKIYPAVGGDSKFIKIKWSKLQEVTPLGEVVASVNSFSSKNFAWVGPDQVVLGAYNATRVTLQSTLEVSGGTPRVSAPIPQFAVSAYVFTTDAVVTMDNQTMTVPKNNVKFSVYITSWPFASANNRLEFGAEIITPGGESPEREDDHGAKMASSMDMESHNGTDSHHESEDHEGHSRFRYGSSNLVVLNTAWADGRQVNVTTTTTQDSAKKNMVTWSFPSFTDRLSYDPTIGYQAKSGASAVGPSFIAAALVAALATAMRM